MLRSFLYLDHFSEYKIPWNNDYLEFVNIAMHSSRNIYRSTDPRLTWSIGRLWQDDSYEFFKSSVFTYNSYPESLWIIKLQTIKPHMQSTSYSINLRIERIFGIKYHKFHLLVDNQGPFDVEFSQNQISSPDIHVEFMYPFSNLKITLYLKNFHHRMVYLQHIDTLAQDCEQLFTSGMCWDMQIQCQDICLKVHEFIIKQRLPQFFQKNSLNLQKQMIVKDMTPSTLRLLIEYAYTGKISIESQTSSISTLAQYLELLKVSQFYFGSVCNLELTREIKHVNEFSGNNIHHQVRCIPLYFAFQFFQVAGYEFVAMTRSCLQQSQILVTIQSKNIFQPTTFYSQVYQGNDTIANIFPRNIILSNDTPYEWVVPHNCCYLCISSVPLESLHLQKLPDVSHWISFGEYKYSQRYLWEQISTCDSSSGDVSLEFDNSQSLKTWKALLSLHSPVFEGLFAKTNFFKENRENRIHLAEFQKRTGSRLNRFMLTRIVEPDTFWNDAELFLFADKYLMLDLLATTSTFLRRHIQHTKDKYKIFEAFVLSIACNDEALYQLCDQRMFCRGLFSDKEFIKMCKLFPQFAFKLSGNFFYN